MTTSPQRKSYKSLASLGLGLLAVLFAPAASALQPYGAYVSIDGALATIAASSTTPGIPYILTSRSPISSTQHGIKLEGNGRAPYMSSIGGAAAVKVWCEGGTAAKDRSEIELQSISMGQGRYTTFRVYVDKKSPQGWVVFAQWHRPKDAQHGGNESPIFDLELQQNLPTGQNKVLVMIRNENNRNGIGSIVVNGTNYFASANMASGTWHTFEVQHQFFDYPSTSSYIKVKMDGQQIATYTGLIAYSFANSMSVYQKFGEYRKGVSDSRAIFFDDVKTDKW